MDYNGTIIEQKVTWVRTSCLLRYNLDEYSNYKYYRQSCWSYVHQPRNHPASPLGTSNQTKHANDLPMGNTYLFL